MTARAAETTYKSHASSTQTASADKKLKQRPVVDLSRMGEEELKGISSKGSSQRPGMSTFNWHASPRPLRKLNQSLWIRSMNQSLWSLRGYCRSAVHFPWF